ncbi:acyltransferase [Flavobacterium sp. LM4]|uniref:acyltransferase n=1 Tax=Flavobacterium sp. LM4 TaxID=1938609 RepID=UPI0016703BA4|nr:acyltransferase [Flavobacterium sp. LM4]
MVYSSVRLLENTIVDIKGSVIFFSGLQLKLFKNARLTIGNGTYFSGPIVIHARENISIGENCCISWFYSILYSNCHEIDENSGIITKEVIIGNNVWIGNNVTILPGTSIENDAIIGAQSIVKGHYKSGGIYAGNPAKLISERH